jgi:hypothetical protein
MRATTRQNRIVELTTKVNETLVPKLSKLDGFKGYYSTKLAASWISDEKLETTFPNPPKITTGKVLSHRNGVTV